MLLLLSACTCWINPTYDPSPSTWYGSSANVLVHNWGEPSYTLNKSHSTNHYLVYERQKAILVPQLSICDSKSVYGEVCNLPPDTNIRYVNCKTYFEVNKNDSIVSTSHCCGNECKKISKCGCSISKDYFLSDEFCNQKYYP